MSFKKIMVPLTGWSGTQEYNPESDALDMALSMADAIDAHVEAYLCAPHAGPTEALIPDGLPGSAAELLMTEIEKAVAERRDAAEAIFEAAMARHQVPRRAEPEESDKIHSVAFVEETGDFSEHLAARARLADLVVVGLGAKGRSVPDIAGTCLRESGRPVLTVPEGRTKWRADTIAIGWNGSIEAARAVSVATDLVSHANKVTVISIDEDGPIEPGANQLVGTLAWHGITADTVTLAGSRETAGSLLIERAEAISADLLVMGAYTRNRFSRLIFGSATADILRGATIPVLMMH